MPNRLYRNWKPLLLSSLMLLTLCGGSVQAEQPLQQPSKSKGKVLVVLSSSKVVTLRDHVKQPTGYFLNELSIPVKALVDAGYEPVFADPDGNEPTMDAHSDNPKFFGSEEKYKEIKAFVGTLKGLTHPERLSEVASGKLNDYVAVFVPGGHAPMEDLWKDSSLGWILKQFHQQGKPTAMICHGPIALLSALDNPEAIADACTKNQKCSPPGNWIYSGYKMTVFSNAEEKPNEDSGRLGARMLFYPEDALRAAGGNVNCVAAGEPNVVVDRELITGQNPSSDKQLAEELLKAVDRKSTHASAAEAE